MSDLLSIASSGLAGYRAALEAVGENVANANVEGFGRRDIQLRARAPGTPHPLFRPEPGGLGVDIAGVRRAHDQFLSSDARDSVSDRARLDSSRTWLAEIETTLGSGEASVGPAITDFYNAAGTVASDPGSIVKRSLFLRSADLVAVRFRSAAASLDNVSTALARETKFQVSELNGLASQLAQVNDRLRRTPPDTSASGGLKDERDRLLSSISEFARIDVRESANGVVDVRLNDNFGPQIVSGPKAIRLADAADGPGLTVRLAKGGADISGFLTGGSVAGLLASAGQLTRSRAVLDDLAGDFATTLNTVHTQGVDLAGAAGEPLFATRTVKVTGSPANLGSAALGVTVADGAPLAAVGYRLFYDGGSGDYLFERRDGSLRVTGPGPLTLDGITIDVSGEAANADVFLLDPVSGAAGLSARLEEPAKVAAAAPFVFGPLLGNAGSGAVAVTPDDSAVLPPAAAHRIVFTTAADFEIQDEAGAVLAAAQPYVPGAAIAGNGFSFTLSGAPANGDRFEIAPSVNATGDASAIRRLLATRQAPVGLSTFEERWDREAGRVSTRLNETNSNLLAAGNAEQNAVGARETRSGVDLDTQAADLIRFQQAYQATARVVQAARDVFDTMLQLG